MLAFHILILLFAANGAPLILARLLGERGNWRVDGGLIFLDGRPLLGPSKTWRGVIGSLLLTPLVAVALSFDAEVGLLAAVLAMLGDLLSSFCKRRLGIRPSGMALGLDQIPEALLPLLVLQKTWNLSGSDIAGLVVAFTVLELALSRVLYWLKIRQQPY